MARKPNYSYERFERERQKTAKRQAKAEAKAARKREGDADGEPDGVDAEPRATAEQPSERA